MGVPHRQPALHRGSTVEVEHTQPAPTEPPAEPTEVPVEPTVEELPEVTITWWHIQVADDQKALWQGWLMYTWLPSKCHHRDYRTRKRSF